MSLEGLTDEKIIELIACTKRVKNPSAREKTEGKHVRRDYQVLSDDGRHEFVLFTRQSTIIPGSYTAGLRWKSRSGEDVILLRCNGNDHEHANPLEKHRFAGTPHVHQATERYISAGKKVETFAEPSSEYRTLSGALHHVMKLANISGLESEPDQRDLWESA